MILTEQEVIDRLQKSVGGPDPLLDDDVKNIVWPAVEAQIKRETRRDFESTAYTEYFNISQNQRSILLPQFPVSAVTSVSYLSSVDSDGTETWEAYDAGDYKADLAAGIIRLRHSCFNPGVGTVKAVYTAGYTSTQIASNSTDEILLLKALLLKIIQREYAINKDQKRHLNSHSWGEESSTYNFDLTSDEERAVNLLRKRAA